METCVDVEVVWMVLLQGGSERRGPEAMSGPYALVHPRSLDQEVGGGCRLLRAAVWHFLQGDCPWQSSNPPVTIHPTRRCPP